MNNLWSELKRRNVVRVAIAYVIVAWVILQFVDVIIGILTLPDWFPQMVLVLLVIGFPIALLISWAFEVTPEGVKKTAEVDKSKSVTHGTGQKINYLIIGGLLFAIGFLLYERTTGPNTPVVDQAEAGTLSIAVLPFADLSPDSDQEYFSDGITEEILNVLVKMPDLQVAGRTSSFAFKGRNKNLTRIGEELNVNFLVEGSVRKSGNQLRITAQLIRASDGFHLWSETYDRELTEIFEIQDEISRAIADALSVSLGLLDLTPAWDETDDLAAYENYLRALSLFKARGYARLTEAIELLTAVTERDPDFVPAWELLAKIYSVYPHYVPNNAQNSLWNRYLTLAELAANKALSLDPNSAQAYSALGNVYGEARQWGKSFENHERAIALNPEDGDFYQQYGGFLLMTGQYQKAYEIAAKGAELEPLSAIIQNLHGYILTEIGQTEEGLVVLRRAWALDPGLIFPVSNILFRYLHQGRFEEAHTFALLAREQDTGNAQPHLDDVVKLTELLKNGAPEAEIRDFQANSQFGIIRPMMTTALHDAELLLADIEGFNFNTYVYGDPFLFIRNSRKIWGYPKFKELVRRAGIYDYWKTTGNWGDACAPVGDDDFECMP